MYNLTGEKDRFLFALSIFRFYLMLLCFVADVMYPAKKSKKEQTNEGGIQYNTAVRQSSPSPDSFNSKTRPETNGVQVGKETNM